ncbi:ECO1 [Candida oxycetoniae]|uniref:N-acetyltransferase ECO1 n=1 Tax=Candida oxycetoniae TaxID=497107 RepID=A0AAI9SZZ0_9ASCO|nr:ECO1 [Candida oxycetoniae]KAI3405834.2 ECO1 [Candida oxycetoniae]
MSLSNEKPKRKVQSTLAIPIHNTMVTCPTCGMTYNSSIATDVAMHRRYHTEFSNGISWPSALATRAVLETYNIVVTVKSNKLGQLKNSVKRETKKAVVQTIDKSNKKQVEKVEQLLKMVNRELNACDDSKQWRSEKFENSKAFVLVVENKAIGVCTTDTINCGQWLVHETQFVVPNQTIKNVCIGISRIWIAPKWRQNGAARFLLNCVLKNSIYGKVLSRNQIAFSQPSHGGGLLAKSFNGVLHKSGKFLIPIYQEF